MGVCMMTIALTIQQNKPDITIKAIILFLILYQASQGSYFWSYAATVSTDTSNSLASIVLWASVLIMATCTHLFLEVLGTEGTFALFSVFCLMGALIFYCTLKETVGLTRE